MLTCVCGVWGDELGQGKVSDLEEDGLSINSPEVGDGVTAVSTTRQQLQSGVTAWTQLLWNTETSQVKTATCGPTKPSAGSYSAVSAGPCHRWPGGAAVWTHRAAYSPENRPPRRDRTSSGFDSYGCWCFSWPSQKDVSERSYLQLKTKPQSAERSFPLTFIIFS